MDSRRPLYTSLIMSACCLVLAGCGSGHPETGKVSGKITYLGKAVTEGTVMFYPEKGRAGVGAIGADGTYQLATFGENDGALLGKHRVTITAYRTENEPEAPKSFEEELALADQKAPRRTRGLRTVWLVPEKYSNQATSPLQKDVAAGENTIDFQLSQNK